MQHWLILAVSKAHAIEGDRAFDTSWIDGIGTLVDHLVGGKDYLDTFQGNGGLRNGAGHARKILHWLEELLQVSEVNSQRTRPHGSRDDQRCALPQHDGSANRHHNADNGRHQRFDLSCPKGGRDGGVACRFQMRHFEVLPPERLGDTDRSKSALYNRQHLALPRAHGPRRLLYGLLEMEHKREKYRRERNRYQRKVPVGQEHQSHQKAVGDENITEI